MVCTAVMDATKMSPFYHIPIKKKLASCLLHFASSTVLPLLCILQWEIGDSIIILLGGAIKLDVLSDTDADQVGGSSKCTVRRKNL